MPMLSSKPRSHRSIPSFLLAPLSALFAMSCFAVCNVHAEDWAGFRGPAGNGIAPANAKAPLTWSDTENVVWKAQLPQPGNGSPIVMGDNIYVASAEDADGRKRSLYCFHRKDGSPRWQQTVDAPKMPTHNTNPYCGSTPAANKDCVVVWHSTAGLYCYDHTGKLLWDRDLGEFKHTWGYGTSPIIAGDRVILHTGPGQHVSVLAFSVADGATLWQHDEPIEGDGSRNEANKYMGSWSTPVLREENGKQSAICAMATRVISLDVATGKLMWHCDGIRGPKGDLAYSSPMLSDNLCVMRGGFNGPSFGVALGGAGDIGKDRLWRREKNPQNIGTGLLLGDHFYMANAGPGTIQCHEAETGKEVWQARAPGNMWGSMILVGKHAYVVAQNGKTLVFEPNPDKFVSVGVNTLNDSCNTTPALADGQFFIRTDGHLWCIGKP